MDAAAQNEIARRFEELQRQMMQSAVDMENRSSAADQALRAEFAQTAGIANATAGTVQRLDGLEGASFEELLERLNSMTLKYRTDAVNESAPCADGPKQQGEAVAAARFSRQPRGPPPDSD